MKVVFTGPAFDNAGHSVVRADLIAAGVSTGKFEVQSAVKADTDFLVASRRGPAVVRVRGRLDALERRARPDERARRGRSRALRFPDDKGQRRGRRCPRESHAGHRDLWDDALRIVASGEKEDGASF